ncbi:hypothetical protein L208DRAFT_918019 [Tricholoma matsutake]|nr:hypothetical protein L208DRAFT_918019 [Tricholoma matsutake 945]
MYNEDGALRSWNHTVDRNYGRRLEIVSGWTDRMGEKLSFSRQLLYDETVEKSRKRQSEGVHYSNPREREARVAGSYERSSSTVMYRNVSDARPIAGSKRAARLSFRDKKCGDERRTMKISEEEKTVHLGHEVFKGFLL